MPIQEQIKWKADVEEATDEARQTLRPVLYDFSAAPA